MTGGASGIGAATARALADAGARVFSGDLADGTLDVTDADSVDAFARGVLAEAGRADVLVNAAGWDRLEPFLENTPELWERIVAVNYLGPVRVTRAFLPAMIEAAGGSIVNVASDAGRVGSTGETVYAGAKGGVIAFTKSLAREMARHRIRANCVAPGPTDTPLFRSLPEKMQEALERAIPFRRLARPEEIADAILFFASDRSAFCTGQVLSVSGGLTMHG